MATNSRVDGRIKVTGTARYSADYPFDNLAHGYLLLSTVGRGTISAVDTAAAQQSGGVAHGIMSVHTRPVG